MLRKICSTAIVLMVSMSPLSAVEYDGEKSYMFEIKYDVCMIPPQEKEAASQGIKIVTSKQAKALYDKQAYFYDTRELRHYKKQHIKGASHVQFDQSKAEYIAINLPKDKNEALVFYCYGESCANSYEAALAVKQQGYKNVYWMLNGFTEWKKKRYPLQ